MEEQVQRVSLKALFIEDGKVFMVRDRGENGSWELPGGRIDYGEAPEEALRRELNEEMGVSEVSIGNPVHLFSFVSSRAPIHFIVIVISCVADLSTVKISDEHSEMGWFSLEETKNMPLREYYRKTLEKVLK